MRCVSYITVNLLACYLVGEKRERGGNRIAMLRLKAGPIYSSTVQPRGGAGLEARPGEAHSSQLIAEQVGRSLAAASAAVLHLPHVRQTIQESPCGNDNGLGR